MMASGVYMHRMVQPVHLWKMRCLDTNRLQLMWKHKLTHSSQVTNFIVQHESDVYVSIK